MIHNDIDLISEVYNTRVLNSNHRQLMNESIITDILQMISNFTGLSPEMIKGLYLKELVDAGIVLGMSAVAIAAGGLLVLKDRLGIKFYDILDRLSRNARTAQVANLVKKFEGDEEVKSLVATLHSASKDRSRQGIQARKDASARLMELIQSSGAYLKKDTEGHEQGFKEIKSRFKPQA